MSIPSSPDKLTNEWLAQKLGYTVNEFEVEHFGEGAGIMGMVTRVHLTTASGPSTIIAKFPSPAAENRAVAATYNMYGREVGFYQNVAPHISSRVPDCYYADFDAQTQDFVILMEDLQGMRIGDQVTGCSMEDAHLVVQGIAKLHASGWQTDLPLVSHNNPAQRDGMIGGFQMGWPVVNEQFADLIPPEAANLDQRVPPKVQFLLDEMCQAPVSVSHTDVRLDNIFFADGEIALVDWQAVCTSAPEQDLAYFVTQSLTDEQRNAEDWVALYHQALTREGVAGYALDDCRARYKISALYLVCFAVVIAGTLDLGNERGIKLGRTLLGNSMRSLVELDAFRLLD